MKKDFTDRREMKTEENKPFFLPLSKAKRAIPVSKKFWQDRMPTKAWTERNDFKRGTWMYKFSPSIRASITEVIANLQTHDVNLVFLDVSNHWLTKYQPQLTQFIAQSHDQAIEVHAMSLKGKGPHYTDLKNHDKACERIDNILRFCHKNPGAAFDGIHLDTEPHTHEDWIKSRDVSRNSEKWRVRENLLKQYLRLLEKVSRRINQAGLQKYDRNPFQFSAAIGYWYDARGTEGILPSAEAETLNCYLDFLVPMVYSETDTNADQVIRRAKNTIRAVPTIIGLKVNNFSTYSNLMKDISAIESHFQSKDTYLGICMFRYDYLINKYESLTSGRKRWKEYRNPGCIRSIAPCL